MKAQRLFARLLICLVSASLLPAADATAQQTKSQYDVVIRNGRVVDGTGAPWYAADVAIADGKIVAIGRIAAGAGEREIDAAGLIVAPGFVDMMGQAASPMLDDPRTAINLITQGITSINAGEGGSDAPVSAEAGRRRGWTTMAGFFLQLESRGLPINVAQTVGHTQVRRLVLGSSDRKPTTDELKQMQGLVAEAMEAGAIGVSTALIYPPAVYADTSEIGALAEVAGRYGGRYYTHMRNEGDQLLEAIDEALEIGRIGNTPVHIFHLKAAGQQNWGKMQSAISKIKEARSAGHQVTADIYPYINNGLGIAALVHPRHFAAGRDAFAEKLQVAAFRDEIRKEMETTDGWENWFRHVGHDWGKIVIGSTPHADYHELAGQSVAEMAAARGEDPWDTFFNLLESGAFALPQSMTEANKIRAMQEEFVSFCTDVGPAGGAASASHPRAFGAFPRLLSRYVRDLGAISLERVIAQASAAGTNNILAYDRGRIAVGLAADVIVFDYEQLTDNATFAKPAELSTGMKYVLVNGQLVLDDGKLTSARPGQVLRGPGYKRLRPSSQVRVGDLDPRMHEFDVHMQAFVEKHQIPGAAVAATKDGKLMFVRGYGYADLATGEQVTPESLFRIASISKPITAVGILQLVDDGKLLLSDSVFEVLELNDEIANDPKRDQRLNQITIEHLLQHRGGWDRAQSFDAMFRAVPFAEKLGVDAPAGPHDVITAMLDQPLDFAPGHRYAYSNFGYCLLGRVIEKLTGQDYDEYTKEHVLQPIGITNMRIGGSHLDQRSPGEVRYHSAGRGPSVFAATLGARVPRQYGGWHLEAMDSHGGWIASAVDLARFAVALDDPENSPLLPAESFERMDARPPGLAGYTEEGAPKADYYSLGWLNRVVGRGKINRWHTGSLDGTATILLRRHDGVNLIALFNTRNSATESHLGRAADRALHEAAEKVQSWPAEDLFSQFEDTTSAANR